MDTVARATLPRVLGRALFDFNDITAVLENHGQARKNRRGRERMYLQQTYMAFSHRSTAYGSTIYPIRPILHEGLLYGRLVGERRAAYRIKRRDERMNEGEVMVAAGDGKR